MKLIKEIRYSKYHEVFQNAPTPTSVVNDHLTAVRQKIIQVNKWKNERKEPHLEARNTL